MHHITSGPSETGSHDEPPGTAASAPAPTPPWPFVGRAMHLRAVLRSVTQGARHGVVLTGPAGVGKTRLALECLRRADGAGIATLDAADDRVDRFRQAAVALLGRPHTDRLVLLVDNAHLVDDDVAALVHHLALTGAAFVVATAPAGEEITEAVVGLWKDGLSERIELDSLDEEAIGQVLASVLGGQVSPATVGQLSAHAQGNLRYLQELVYGALADGTLVWDGGWWRLEDTPTASSRLIDLVERQLRGLDTAQRALLEVVAVGQPLGEAELTALADPAVAEWLERQGLLSSRLNGRRLEVRLAHPVHADVLRARLPAARARAIARSLAGLAQAIGARRSEDVVRVAAWRLAGGGGAQPEVLLAGAVAARQRHRYARAERLARAAMEAGGGFDAALRAAHLAGLRGHTSRAEHELAALATGATEDAQRGAVALARIHNSVLWTGHDPHRIIDHADGTVTDPAWRERLSARRVGLLLHTEGPRAAAAAAAPLLAGAHGDALAFAGIVAAYSLGRLGRLQASLEAAARAEAAGRTTASRAYGWWSAVMRCQTLNHAGRLDEAATLAAAHHRRAVVAQAPEARAAFALMGAVAVARRGRVHTAARCAREALALSREVDQPLMVRPCLTWGAVALALGGQGPEAAELLVELDALDLPAELGDDVEAMEARAWTAAALGHLDQAHRHLHQAATRAREIGDAVGEITALHDLARLGRATEVRERLAAVAAAIDGDLAPALVVHTDALAGDDASRLDQVSRTFEAMGADLLGADASAAAASARQRLGDLAGAAASERRAGALARRCEGAVTPALQAMTRRARLTAAERAVASLAASGCSNRRIAQTLGLSVRTVENRLQRVYQKLRISGRAALPDELPIH